MKISLDPRTVEKKQVKTLQKPSTFSTTFKNNTFLISSSIFEPSSKFFQIYEKKRNSVLYVVVIYKEKSKKRLTFQNQESMKT